MRPIKILFLLEANEKIGLGHWVRCMALADCFLKNYGPLEIHWLVNPLSPALRYNLVKKKYFFYEGFWRKTQNIEAFLDKSKYSILVLDLMDSDKNWIKRISKQIPIISIGGSGDGRDFVSVRFDGMFIRPGYCDRFKGQQLYAGPGFIILRNTFESVVPKPIQNKVSKVTVMMGGDAYGYGLLVARTLAEADPKVKIDLIGGPLFNVPTDPISERITVHISVDPIPYLNNADLVISSGGMSAFEAVSCGTPSVLLPTNSIQLSAARSMSDNKIAINLGLWDKSISTIRDIIRSNNILTLEKKERHNYRKNGMRFIDGKGVYRVANIIWSNINGF